MNDPPPEVIEQLKAFLKEDVRSGDITTNAMEPLEGNANARIYAKEKSLVAGVEEIAAIAKFSGLQCEVLVFEGNWVEPGQTVIKLTGPAKTLLIVERLCLNIIMRMSGIATKTYRMVQAARRGNADVRVAATRKTTPGFRYFEKRAVKVGGGDSHRYALDDMVLIKNNHIDVVGGVGQAIRLARKAVSFSKKISCEARNLDEALEAVRAGADIILLDNFSPEKVHECDALLKEKELRDRVLLEISGGIDETNITAYAGSGIDIISSGALTHSYKSSDYSMKITLDK
ncbi:MAG: carboxylating nicotinate-nucleotide diphosphorylase [Candidatus Thorarchaeota archaeon]